MNCERNNNMCVKDSTIMLFGKKIPVPEYHIPASSQKGCQIQANSTTMNSCSNTKHKGVEIFHTENFEKSKNSSKVNNSIPLAENKETSSTDQEKILKKPDKIVQCPRCNSFDTKFCYFNNYNVNQPRHFCRNCHRYWTAGGTMRSVPVGSGRRKNKHIASQYRHMIVASNGNPTESLGIENSSRYQNVSKDNGIVLKFGHDASLREEEESSLCVSSVSNGYTRGNELSESEYNRSNSLQNYPASQWMVPLNQSWNNVSSMAQSSMQWCHAPMVAVPNILTPNIPLQFVHGSYWHGNGTVSIGSNGCISPSSTSSNSCCSGNGSPNLEDKPEMRVFVPKTLSISETDLE